MIYRTVKLYDLLHSKVGKEEIKNVLADFSCPLNDDVENFVRFKAYDFERVGMCRTYLVYTYDESETAVMCGMYSLTPGTIELDKELTQGMKKRLLGTTYPIGNNIKSYLIGQLSKNYKDGHDKLITGEILLELAFERIRQNNVILPSTVVHIDCKDVPQLKRFYEKYGFSYFHTNQSGLLVYLMPTNKIMEVEYKKALTKG